jgi:hypothetical protein
MIEVLRQALAEVSTLAGDLSKQAARADGKVAPLVVAQAVVTADKLRTVLRRLVGKIEAASAKG